ncbi:MAG: RNA polymerase sigma factor [Balneolaceae bacterium]
MFSAEGLLLILALSKSDGFEENELYLRIRKGDHQAFKMFYNRHSLSLYRFIVSRGMDEADAQDLVQKAFVLVWEKRDGIDPAKSLRAYLFQIAYTRMLNHFRDNKKFDDSEEIPVGIDEKTPAENLENKLLKKAIDKAIQAMPEKRRMVFEFCFLKDFTYRETAEVMNVSVKTVENHMALALKDMRKSLKRFHENEKIE